MELSKKDSRLYETLYVDNNLEDSEYSEVNTERVNVEYNTEKISHRKFVSKDLLIIFLTALLAIIVIFMPKLNDTFIKTILEFLLILFIPGYSLLAALFPKIDDLSRVLNVLH